MQCTLVATQHDPEGRLTNQIERVLPQLGAIFPAIAIQATHASHAAGLATLRAAGALVQQEAGTALSGIAYLGSARRAAIELGLQAGDGPLLLCDLDRALHWAECHPAELAAVATRLADAEFTVLGRTARAFGTHPRIQRDTEAIINHVFAQSSGLSWDVTAAARGCSRRAAQALLAGCPEQSIGVDVAWPLFLQRAGGCSLGYIATEGLEFETADRYADQIAAAGGLARWMAQLDQSPQQWAFRLDLARIEVAAAAPYAAQTPST